MKQLNINLDESVNTSVSGCAHEQSQGEERLQMGHPDRYKTPKQSKKSLTKSFNYFLMIFLFETQNFEIEAASVGYRPPNLLQETNQTWLQCVEEKALRESKTILKGDFQEICGYGSEVKRKCGTIFSGQKSKNAPKKTI